MPRGGSELAMGPANAAGLVVGPSTEREPLTETLHGIEVDDPYRWLEGSAAPEMTGVEPDLDRRVAAWTAAQNAYTRTVLDAVPGRRELEERLRALMDVDQVTAPAVRAGRYFFLAA